MEESKTLETLTQANEMIGQLNDISKTCLLYQKGANADTCMKTIVEIITAKK